MNSINQRGFSLLIVSFVILLLVCLVAGAYFLGTQNEKSVNRIETAPNQQTEITNSQTITSNSASHPTENWKSFSSKEFKFKLNYPSEYKDANTVGETNDPTFTFSSPDYQASSGGVSPEDNKERMGKYLQVFVCKKSPCYYLIDSNVKNQKETTFQGKSATSYDYVSIDGNNQLVLDISQGMGTYTLTLDTGPNTITSSDRELFDLFTNSFKFQN